MQLTRRGAARLTSLAVLSSLTLAGCNHSQTTDGGSVTSPTGGGGAVATITTPKGATLSISQAEFYAQLQGFVPNSQPSAASPQGSYAPPGQQAGRLVLGRMLQSLMVEGLAQDQGVAPTDAEINAQYDDFKTMQQTQLVKPFDQALADAGLNADLVKNLQLRPQLTQLKLATKGATITDADLQKFFDANKDKPPYTTPARVHIKKIVVATLSDAQAISKTIVGGKSFESQVAQSLDKSTPDGDVPNWVPLDPVPPALAAVIKPIADAKTGQVTPPIAVPGGPGSRPTYWLVKVVERKEKENLKLDQVKELVRAQMLQQKIQADPTIQQTLQQSLRDFQTHVKITIPETQYASLVQQLTQPAPAAPSGGNSPFAPAHP
jgi:parvulin-like peptidyl-prolyl isomerase